jgi:hypothetical protein
LRHTRKLHRHVLHTAMHHTPFILQYHHRRQHDLLQRNQFHFPPARADVHIQLFRHFCGCAWSQHHSAMFSDRQPH